MDDQALENNSNTFLTQNLPQTSSTTATPANPPPASTTTEDTKKYSIKIEEVDEEELEAAKSRLIHVRPREENENSAENSGEDSGENSENGHGDFEEKEDENSGSRHDDID